MLHCCPPAVRELRIRNQSLDLVHVGWLTNRLFVSVPSSSAGPKGQASLYAGWNTHLAAEENASFWKALPPDHRNSFLKRLEALREEDENEDRQE